MVSFFTDIENEDKKGFQVFINEASDVQKEFKAILVVDDEKELCRMLCLTLQNMLFNTVIFGCCCSVGCPSLARMIYFDVVASDIHMPGLYGNKLLKEIQSSSPTTYIIAMTGHSLRDASLAGSCQPDFFFGKDENFDILKSHFPKGLAESERRRLAILPGRIWPQGKAPNLEELNWREKQKFHEGLGFTKSEYELSMSLVKVHGLQKMKADLTESELCAMTGFVSERVMRERMKELELAAIVS